MGFFGFLIFSFLVVIALFAFPFFRKPPEDIGKANSKLDTAGFITNILLGLLYLPLSIVGYLFGMVSEAYMEGSTAVQNFLCDSITILGVLTPVVAFGGILCSALLRRQRRSKLSFLTQFSGLIHLAVCICLIIILDHT
ncbi:MAG: hypothetical protein J6K89_05215 [Oscillospiraceae bacterium]|nr:hypothetical protein [Oscillospiraceae bacterium]